MAFVTTTTNRFSTVHLLMLLMMTIVVLVCLPQGHQAGLLEASFDKVPLQGKMLVSYETINYEARSPGKCAAECSDRRALTPACQAFEYHPLDGTCTFYKKGTSVVSVSTIDVFLFHVTDIWYRVAIGGRLFSMYVSSKKRIFVNARSYCIELGGYLLEFESPEESLAVRMVTIDHLMASVIYVGANDIQTEGLWVTDREGRPLSETGGLWIWHLPVPDNEGGDEHCGSIRSYSTLMEDVRCNKQIPFLLAAFLYVGANDIQTEGQWVTDRESRPLSDTGGLWIWHYPVPDNGGDGEHCGSIRSLNTRMEDVPCTWNIPFLCERDGQV